MGRRAGVFLKESVILFGFLNGVWVAVGVNPGQRLVEVLADVLFKLSPTRGAEALVTLLPFLLTGLVLLLVYKVWRKGRWLGMAAVACGFLAGMQILGDPLSSLTLLAAAGLLGYAATK